MPSSEVVESRYCEALFEDLAVTSPDALIAMLSIVGIPSSRLTFAAEILGRDVKTSAAIEALKSVLLYHSSALVREGAVLGLGYNLDASGVRDALFVASQDDPSPGVRKAAKEALD